MKLPSIRALAFALCLHPVLAAPPEGKPALVRDGKPVTTILLGEGISPSDEAVKILVSHIQQMSGATLPVLAASALGEVTIQDAKLVPAVTKTPSESFILLGYSKLAETAGYSLKGVGPGGILVETRGNTVGLFSVPQPLGNRKQEAARPAIALLESLGCRYLWPGETGKVVPRHTTVETGKLDIRFTPRIAQRYIRFMPDGPRSYDKGAGLLGVSKEEATAVRQAAMKTESPADWMFWNGQGGQLGIRGGHAGYGLEGGWAANGAKHPEWFAMQGDGSRNQAGANHRWTACVSNPDLIAHIADTIIAKLNGRPIAPISLAPNDGGLSGPCMCEECKKLDPPDAPKVKIKIFPKAGGSSSTEIEYPSLTDRHVHFWNAIAERVAKVVQGQEFVIDAYTFYSDPPVREKLLPNLILRYVPSELDGWDGWRKAGASKIFWRPNNLHGNHATGILKPVARRTAESIKKFADAGMLATDMQGIYNNWATQGLEYYMAQRFSWNPDQSFDEVLDDYCRSGFGAGAGAVKEYFLTFDKECTLANRLTKVFGTSIPLETEKKLRSLLEQAAAATKNDPASRRRVDFLRAGLEFSAISVAAYRLGESKERGESVDPKTVKELLDRRWKLMRDILLKENLAVNTPLVAVGDASCPIRNLAWTPPKAGATVPDTRDNWLYEDQSDTRRPATPVSQ